VYGGVEVAAGGDHQNQSKTADEPDRYRIGFVSAGTRSETTGAQRLSSEMSCRRRSRIWRCCFAVLVRQA
jgi:hypothetical protein